MAITIYGPGMRSRRDGEGVGDARRRRLGVSGVAALVFTLGSWALPAIAVGDYSGTVQTATQQVTLTGTGNVVLSTGGGVLHHGDLGTGFASGTDFDSTQPGDQTVPDTGGWTIDVTGGGHDSLEVDEGEATNPVSYAFGHTYYPGGTPCVVRDPNDRNGIVAFSLDPAEETYFCYPAGIDSVTVRGGAGAVQYGVLDTASGVPLHLYGGPGDSTLSEAANTPDDVGGYHEPASPVYFTSTSPQSTISYIDGPVTAPGKYTIDNGAITRSGLPAVHYSGPLSEIDLYPEMGASTIDIGPTGGALVQIFGDFFGQTGPDTIDGSDSDAPLLITGSLGDDKIIAGPAGGYVAGGGGSDTITAVDDDSVQVVCSSGSASTVFATTLDQVQGCATVHHVKPTLPLRDLAFSPSTVKGGATATLQVPIYVVGKLTLTFDRATCKHGHGCHHYVSEGKRVLLVKPASSGPRAIRLSASTSLHGRLRKLPGGTYRVAIQLAENGLKSATVDVTLKIR